ncbi:MAG: peptidase M23, partial [Epsilonproteobacteria bacterium]|nr:peptidase M23 [Campylobacterota bacterium]
MIRLFFIFILFTSLLVSKTSVDVNIKKTSNKLNYFSRNYLKLNKKMAKTAKAILNQKKEINRQQIYLDKLKKELKQKETIYQKSKKDLKNLDGVKNTLKSNQQKLEEELVFTISQSVSLSVILEEEVSVTKESMMEFEVLKVMLQSAKKKIKKLNSRFYEASKNVKSLSKKVSSLEVTI